jgi:hypothetical protein
MANPTNVPASADETLVSTQAIVLQGGNQVGRHRDTRLS